MTQRYFPLREPIQEGPPELASEPGYNSYSNIAGTPNRWKRISDPGINSIAGASSDHRGLRHIYAQYQCITPDGKYIPNLSWYTGILTPDNGFYRILGNNVYVPRVMGNNSDFVIGVDKQDTRRLLKVNIHTSAETLIKTFTNSDLSGSGIKTSNGSNSNINDVSIGKSQGGLSRDGSRAVIQIARTDGKWECFLTDLNNGSIISQKVFDSLDDYVTVHPDGKHIIQSRNDGYNNGGNGAIAGYRGANIYDENFNFKSRIGVSGHIALGFDLDDVTPLIVGEATWQMVKFPIDTTGDIAPIRIGGGPNRFQNDPYSMSIHVSPALEMPGHYVVSLIDPQGPNNLWTITTRESFGATEDAYHWGYHQSAHPEDGGQYYGEPHVNCTVEGDRIFFASDWSRSPSLSNVRMYLIETRSELCPNFPDQTLTVEENAVIGTVVGQLVATDTPSGNNTITSNWRLAHLKNAGFAITDSGLVTVALPSATANQGQQTIAVAVEGSQGNTYNDVTINVTSGNTPMAVTEFSPIIATTSLPQAVQGVAIPTVTLEATLPAGATAGSIVWSHSGSMPPGISRSGNTISGTWTGANDTGQVNIVVTATNSVTGESSSRKLFMDLNQTAVGSNITPQNNNTGNYTDGTVGVYYRDYTDGKDINGDTILFGVNGSLPPGLTFNSAGMLDGVPTQAGTFTVSFTMEDQAQIPGTFTRNITINNVGNPPVITKSSGPLDEGHVGQYYQDDIPATDPDGDVLTYSVTSGALPAGLQLGLIGGNTGCNVYGTPTANGTFNFEITALDTSNQSATKAFSIKINDGNSPPEFVNTILPSGRVGDPYNVQIQTHDDEGDDIVYNLVNQNDGFHTGLTMNSAGIVSGTPTQSGTKTPAVRIHDAANLGSNALNERDITLYIAPATTTGNQPPEFLSSILPQGTQDIAYSENLNTFVNDPDSDPLTFTLVNANNSGLTLSTAGILSGTPTVAGGYQLVISIDDGNNAPVENQMYLLINATGSGGGSGTGTYCVDAATGTLVDRVGYELKRWEVNGTSLHGSSEPTGNLATNNGWAEYTVPGLIVGETYYIHAKGSGATLGNDSFYLGTSDTDNTKVGFLAISEGGTSNEVSNNSHAFIATTTSQVIKLFRREPLVVIDSICVSTSATDPDAGLGGSGGGGTTAGCRSATTYNNKVTTQDREWVTSGTDLVATGVSSISTGAAASARVDYEFSGLSNETHYVWIEGTAPDGNSDTVYINANGEATTADTLTFVTQGEKTFVRWAPPITPSGGGYTLSIWMREKDFILHRVCLTTSQSSPGGGTSTDPLVSENLIRATTPGGDTQIVNLNDAIISGSGTLSCAPSRPNSGGSGGSGTDETLTAKGAWVEIAFSGDGSTERAADIEQQVDGIIAAKNSGTDIAGVILKGFVKRWVDQSDTYTDPATVPAVSDMSQLVKQNVVPKLRAAGLGMSIFARNRWFGASNIGSSPFPSFWTTNGWVDWEDGGGNVSRTLPDMDNINSAIACAYVEHALYNFFGADMHQVAFSGETTSNHGTATRVAWFKKWAEIAKEGMPNSLPVVEMNFLGNDSNLREVADEMVRIGGVAWGWPDTHRCGYDNSEGCKDGSSNQIYPAYKIFNEEYKDKIPCFPRLETAAMVLNPNNEMGNCVENNWNGLQDGAQFAVDVLGANFYHMNWNDFHSVRHNAECGTYGFNGNYNNYVKQTANAVAVNQVEASEFDYNLGSGSGAVSTGSSVDFSGATFSRSGSILTYNPSSDVDLNGEVDVINFCIQDDAPGGTEHLRTVSFSYQDFGELVSPTCLDSTGEVGQGYSSSVVPNGEIPNTNYAFSGLPAGLSGGDGFVIGTPTESGDFTVTITASLDGYNDVTITCPLSIAPEDTVNEPVCPTNLGTVNVAYNSSIANGQSGVSYNITEGALPNGLSLNSATGAVTGTPTVAAGFSFVVTADDGNSTASRACSITIGAVVPVPPTNITGVITEGKVGNAYNSTLGAVGGVSPYGFSIAGHPAGLQLSNNILSGTPTQAGTYVVDITAVGSDGGTLTKQYTIVIEPADVVNQPPIIVGSYNNGVVDTAYDSTLSISDPNGDAFSVALTSGSVPAGLSLATNGRLFGTPTAAGTYPFQITVTDSQGASAVVSQSVTIQAATGGGGGGGTTDGEFEVVGSASGIVLGAIDTNVTVHVFNGAGDETYDWFTKKDGMLISGVVQFSGSGNSVIASSIGGGLFEIWVTVSGSFGSESIKVSEVLFAGSGTTNGHVIGSDLTITVQ